MRGQGARWKVRCAVNLLGLPMTQISEKRSHRDSILDHRDDARRPLDRALYAPCAILFLGVAGNA